MHDEQAKHIARCSVTDCDGSVKLIWEDDRVEIEVLVPFAKRLECKTNITFANLPPFPRRTRLEIDSDYYLEKLLRGLPIPTEGDATVSDPTKEKRIFEGEHFQVIAGGNEVWAFGIKPERKG